MYLLLYLHTADVSAQSSLQIKIRVFKVMLALRALTLHHQRTPGVVEVVIAK